SDRRSGMKSGPAPPFGSEEKSSVGATGNLLPARASEGGHAVHVFGHDLPVHHDWPGARGGRHRVGDIGAADRERAANDDPDDQAHGGPPYRSLLRAPGRP